jgi:hypothetical protein
MTDGYGYFTGDGILEQIQAVHAEAIAERLDLELCAAVPALAEEPPTVELARPAEIAPEITREIAPEIAPPYPSSPMVLVCSHSVPFNSENGCASCNVSRRREVMTDAQREVEDLIDEFTRAAAAGDTVNFFTRLVGERMRARVWDLERRRLEDEVRDLRRIIRDLNRTYRPVSRDVGDPLTEPRDFRDPSTTFPVE